MPKVTRPEQVRQVVDVMPAGACVLPLIEMASGVIDAPAICGVAGVTRRCSATPTSAGSSE